MSQNETAGESEMSSTKVTPRRRVYTPVRRPIVRPAIPAARPSAGATVNLVAQAQQTLQTAGCPTGTCGVGVAGVSTFSTGDVTCNSRNNYLDSLIQDEKRKGSFIGNITTSYEELTEKPENAGLTEVFKFACVEKVMNTDVVQAGTYAYCAPGQRFPKIMGVKPCINNNYKNLTHNSMNLAASCLRNFFNPIAKLQDEDFKSIFGMLYHESGLQTSLYYTGGSGLGQMTQNAISQMNTRRYPSTTRRGGDTHIDQIRKYLKTPGLPKVCSEIGDTVLKTDMNPNAQNACERISVQGMNPLKNILYTLANVKHGRDSAIRSVNNDRAFINKLPVDIEVREELYSKIGVWSHNTGPNGIIGPFRKALYAFNKKIDKNNIEEFLQIVRRQLRGRHGTNYYNLIQSKLRTVDPQGGGTSCINNQN